MLSVHQHISFALLHTFAWTVSFSLISSSQTLSTSIHGADWGISDPSEIRLAQFSTAHTPDGPLFNVQAIYAAGYFSKIYRRPDNPPYLTVADFNDPFVNLLGGSYHGFQSGSGKAELIHSISRISGDQTLRLRFSKGSDGYCGFWMNTFNSAAPLEERRYLDATAFSALMITIRGTTGRERLLLKAADDVWNVKEDALPVGDIGRYLPQGRIDTAWQTAVIPLSAFPSRLNPARLATIAFEVIGSDSGEIEFSVITFCKNIQLLPQPMPIQKRAAEPERALWIWNTSDLNAIQSELSRLQSVVRDLRVHHVFLALPYDAEHPQARNGVPIDHDQMARVVRILNAWGLKVHALIGDKDFIKPQHRGFVRTTMENIVRYQQGVEPAAQFYGIHLDVEPYLLPGFGSEKQSWFLQNLLEVFAECAPLARSARMVIGADIPAWLDAPNELTHERTEILWNGVSQSAYRHVIDIVDFVVLMDYRTAATGEGGFVSQAVNELRYAAETQKKVFVGLETIPLLDETLFVIRGEPKRGYPTTDGKALCAIPANDRILFVLPTNQSALAGFLKENNKIAEDILWWPVSRETGVPASRLTFAGSEGALRLERAIRDSESLLRLFPSFAGFAFHDYKGMRTLLSK